MRIVHLSDLHFGRHDPRLADNLAAEVIGQGPDLVVISGDFTQVGAEEEFRAAGRFLASLPIPVFAVPGNHDVPARNLILRFLSPYRYYRRHVSPTLEPTLDMNGVTLVGLNTARRMRLTTNWADGAVDREQLLRLKDRLAAMPADNVKVVVMHHPVLLPAVAGTMATVKRADLALATFADLGVHLVLSGHFHLSYVRRHDGGIGRDQPLGARRAAAAPILVAQAATAISTRLRGEPNAFNVIDIGGGTIDVKVREWQSTGWGTRERAVETV